ncbi:hypothetical protein FRZ06_00080 [Anoxybacterium hadale]|uniref:Uncharacterized protein n=1 Tax=Anoxybacterium hadale TaxID=3408580 RepID=A0ACD1A643_9FIRM|nr:hypothetical protein FRZ06_00080 [Clostridiales bacterium]
MDKRKLFFSMITFAIIIGVSFLYINASQLTSIDYNSMVQVINSIENDRAKEVVLDLYYAPVYSTSTTSEVKDGDQPETEKEQEDANDNEEFKEEIKKLSVVSGAELEGEVKKIVEKIVSENIKRDNISWNPEFVDKYIKKYCPEYLPLIEEK